MTTEEKHSTDTERRELAITVTAEEFATLEVEAAIPTHSAAHCADAWGSHAQMVWAQRLSFAERMLALAPVATVDVPAERGSAARLDGTHDLEPPRVEPAGHALTVSAAGAAEDHRHACALARHAASASQDLEVRQGVVERLENLAGGACVRASSQRLRPTSSYRLDLTRR